MSTIPLSFHKCVQSNIIIKLFVNGPVCPHNMKNRRPI